MSKIYILYHAGCLDGFGAALAAYLKFGDSATYLPVNYGQEIPNLEKNSHVYLLDFCYDREVIIDLIETQEKVVILDHHKTAAEALLGINCGLFDLNRSGAMITWEYFHPEKKCPQVYRHIQDRDLWKWQLEDSREITAALWTIGLKSFDDWLPYLQDENLSQLFEMGKTVLKVNEGIIKSQVARSYLGTLPYSQEIIPLVNCSILQSETCHQILEEQRYQKYAVVAAWYRDGESVKYSLRSRPNFDCSTIAKSYGGGGHPQASGFVSQEYPNVNNL